MNNYFMIDLSKLTSYEIYNLIKTKQITSDMPEFDLALSKMGSISEDNAYTLIVDRLVPLASKFYDKFALKAATNSYYALDLILDRYIDRYSKIFEPIILSATVYARAGNDTNLLLEAAAFNLNLYQKVLARICEDSAIAYRLISEGKIAINSPYYEMVLKAAIKDSREAYYLLINQEIDSNNPFFKEVVLAVLERDGAAYRLLSENIVTSAFDLYETVLEEAIQNNYNAYRLIKRGKILPDSPLFDDAVRNALQGSKYYACDLISLYRIPENHKFYLRVLEIAYKYTISELQESSQDSEIIYQACVHDILQTEDPKYKQILKRMFS